LVGLTQYHLQQDQPQTRQSLHRLIGKLIIDLEPLHEAKDEREDESTHYQLHRKASLKGGAPHGVHVAQQGEGQSGQREQLQLGAQGDDQRYLRTGNWRHTEQEQAEAQVIPIFITLPPPTPRITIGKYQTPRKKLFFQPTSIYGSCLGLLSVYRYSDWAGLCH
jgi:hypothetical protein